MPRSTAFRPGLIAFATIFLVSGTLHFLLTGIYLRLMPDWLPSPRGLVLVSGAAELAGAIALLIPQTRRAAAWGLFVLLLAVFPANITMVQHPERFPAIPHWAAWARLPLQLPLLLWAWQYTRVPQRRFGPGQQAK